MDAKKLPNRQTLGWSHDEMRRPSDSLMSVVRKTMRWEGFEATFGPSLILTEGMCRRSMLVVFHQFGPDSSEIFSSGLRLWTSLSISASRKERSMGAAGMLELVAECLNSTAEMRWVNIGKTAANEHRHDWPDGADFAHSHTPNYCLQIKSRWFHRKEWPEVGGF
jgi:hypothetical protein